MLLKFVSLDKMIITSLDQEDDFRRSGEGLIISLGLKAKTGLKRYKKANCVIGNVSMKEISKVTRDF